MPPAGNLSVLYLGTEPPKQALAFSESRPVDYAAMEQERVALLAQLKAAGGTAGLEAAAAAKAEAKEGSSQAALVLKAQVPTWLDSADSNSISGSFGSGLGAGAGGQQQRQLTVTLLLSNTTAAALQVSEDCCFDPGGRAAWIASTSLSAGHVHLAYTTLTVATMLQDVYISVLAPAPVEAAEAQASLPQLAAARRGSAPAAVQLQFQHPGNGADKSVCLPASNLAQVGCADSYTPCMVSHSWQHCLVTAICADTVGWALPIHGVPTS